MRPLDNVAYEELFNVASNGLIWAGHPLRSDMKREILHFLSLVTEATAVLTLGELGKMIPVGILLLFYI